MGPLILRELAIILAVSILVISVSRKLRIPTVAGFLLTGILIGPSGLKLVKNVQVIDVLAEIGVMMLLFIIGLEFSREKLKQIKKFFWAGGSLQVVLTTMTSTAGFLLLGSSPYEGVFYGFLISLSSTAVVLKILSDRAETDSLHGKMSLGILLFQDLALVPMIALVPLLADAESVSLVRILARFGLSILAIGIVFLVARRVMPKVLGFIVRLRVREAFIIASLLACLGLAVLTSSLGLSLALGAFLAGIIIAESEYSHQVVSDILPFKDLFNSLFFISIGMLFVAHSAWRSKFLILGLVLLVFVLKTALIFVVVKILRYHSRIALVTGLSLAQVGEFSFVLAGVGRSNGLLPEPLFQAFIASSLLTIFATPFFIRFASGLAERAERVFGWKPGPVELTGEITGLENHVLIAGFGLNGQNLARVLKETGIPYVILDLNPDTVKKSRERGEPIIFGDVSSRKILQAAALERAKVVVFAVSDPQATRRAVTAARKLSRGVFLIVRTRYTAEIDELYRLGADEVIPEEFETSIEIFVRVLEEFHIPRNIVDAQVKVVRSERYGMLRGMGAPRPSLERISELLKAGTTETYFVSGRSAAAGRTLAELDLRRATGATLIAVVRGEKSFTSPPPDFRIQEEDTLVLVASHRDMDRAFDFLGR